MQRRRQNSGQLSVGRVQLRRQKTGLFDNSMYSPHEMMAAKLRVFDISPTLPKLQIAAMLSFTIGGDCLVL